MIVKTHYFYGIKVYDDSKDIDLLNLVNPIVKGILNKCERMTYVISSNLLLSIVTFAPIFAHFSRIQLYLRISCEY